MLRNVSQYFQIVAFLSLANLTEQCVKMWPNFGQKKYYIQTLFAAQQKSQQPAAKPAAFGIDPMLVGQPFTTGTYP